MLLTCAYFIFLKREWKYISKIKIQSWHVATASATSNGHRRLPGDPGHLEVRFFKFSNKQWTFLSFERNYTGSEHKFQIESATVELDTGMIEISGDAGNEVAENLALAFSVALLHVRYMWACGCVN